MAGKLMLLVWFGLLGVNAPATTMAGSYQGGEMIIVATYDFIITQIYLIMKLMKCGITPE